MSIVAKWLDGSRWHLAWRCAFIQATLCYMGNQLPSPKKGQSLSPIFGPFLLWPNGWMHHDAIWYGGRFHPSRLCVRWGPSCLPKRRQSYPFLVHVYCGQTAAWIKMTLGTEVGVGPDDIVLDGDPAPPSPKRGWSPLPSFWLMSIAAKRLHGSRCHVVRR